MKNAKKVTYPDLKSSIYIKFVDDKDDHVEICSEIQDVVQLILCYIEMIK